MLKAGHEPLQQQHTSLATIMTPGSLAHNKPRQKQPTTHNTPKPNTLKHSITRLLETSPTILTLNSSPQTLLFAFILDAVGSGSRGFGETRRSDSRESNSNALLQELGSGVVRLQGEGTGL